MAKISIVSIKQLPQGTYQLNYYTPACRRRRLSVGKELFNAQRMAAKFTDFLLAGLDPEAEMERARCEEKSRNISLSEFYDTFMQQHGVKQSPKMQELYKDRFKHIRRCPQLCDIPMGKITKHLFRDYMQFRIKKDGASPATCNREMAVIKCMLGRAVEWDLLTSNPLVGFKSLKESPKREVLITFEQIAELIENLSEPASSVVEFAVYTGFRKQNILSLKLNQIRFHDVTPTGEVELVVKGGRREIFPLSPAAVEVIKRNAGDRKKGYVFLSPETGTRLVNIDRGFNGAVRKLGLEVNQSKLRFHDIRHIHATWLHKAGVSLDVVRILLGHRDVSTTDRYVSYDRLSYGDALSNIPRLGVKNKIRIQEGIVSESVRRYSVKNCQKTG